ncbi:SDR family oxidoreductase [Nocardia arthritidis]|nr:SDR family oxidoreductase [Nocardia arthritidis]
MNNSDDGALGLAGKVAVVTGGSRGLGAAIARKLCACGCDVLLNYANDDDAAARLVAELDESKGTAFAVKGDIRRADGLAGVLDAVRGRHGRVDVFVHNVATWQPMSAVGAVAEDLHADIATAVDPLIRAAGPLAGLMPAGGRIIAVSSNGARSVIPRYVSLGLAKAALEALVRYLAVELADRGIAVNAVSTAKIDKGPGSGDPGMLAALAARTPAGRLTRPTDIADVVALLCTAEAAWIHGQVITADGGLSLRA